jgi:hypothetical protein
MPKPERPLVGFMSKSRARPGRVAAGWRWLHAFHLFMGILAFKQTRSALIDIDPANLSEAGREARREALYELRDTQRRARRDARPGRP